ncbi:PREDICTED: uncharacterized protein LOC105568828 isoform X1 [Vollenhovia emeryi]|uniref:uncharacterized protein LOC105568828 isoform X1 n=1 Tax=Vollenhovia emeryi TaxID=411798 RepID=UPI0005F3960B|nr:PREDICTED: uncharacterized protein LOC105568828 isoform X1 [Vollenhovia emeryi]
MHELHVTEKVNPVATLCDLKKDLQLSIQLNRWILKPLGAWPKSNQISSIERYAYALINVICTSLIGFLFVPSAIYLVLEMDDAYNILKLTGPLNFCLMAVVKYSSLIFREDDIRSGIEHIASDWTNTQHYDDRIIMIRNAKFGRRLVTICAFFMYGGATFYYLALPFNNGKITEDGGNLTYRPLMYPVARVIVDARHSPISEIFFWTQCLSGFIVHSITTGACSLAAVFAMHAYGRLEVLMQWIEHLVDGREDFCNNIDERLKMIVQQHVRVLHFISLTDKILREISVVEIVGCTLSMCLLGYYLIMVCILYEKYVPRREHCYCKTISEIAARGLQVQCDLDYMNLYVPGVGEQRNDKLCNIHCFIYIPYVQYFYTLLYRRARWREVQGDRRGIIHDRLASFIRKKGSQPHINDCYVQYVDQTYRREPL